MAAAFNSLTWIAKEVDAVENGSLLINCMENETLKRLIDDKDRHFATKPIGKWLIEKPPGWTRIFVFGLDTRKPFEVEDYDLVEKFQALKFKVTAIEFVAMVVSPISEDSLQKEKDTAAEELKAAMEGADKPKGAPLTTYSMPKRKPGRPPRVRPETI